MKRRCEEKVWGEGVRGGEEVVVDGEVVQEARQRVTWVASCACMCEVCLARSASYAVSAATCNRKDVTMTPAEAE